jgi:hypothetical protein
MRVKVKYQHPAGGIRSISFDSVQHALSRYGELLENEVRTRAYAPTHSGTTRWNAQAERVAIANELGLDDETELINRGAY